jgi:Family of unknown function (DUF6600)
MRINFANGAIVAAFVVISSTSSQAAKVQQTPLAQPKSMVTVTIHPRSAAPQHAAGSLTALPPAARVGRVSLVAGKVEYRGPGDAQWSPATINDPVATGTALRTDGQARAEIRIGTDTVDLAESTEITLSRLDRAIAEIAVKEGRIDLDIRRFERGESIQIDIPRGGVWVLDSGRYDIDAGSGNGLTRIAALTGNARFVGSGADLSIAAGSRLALDSAGPKTAKMETAAKDDFAKWCEARGVDDSRLAAPYFVSRDMTGYAALDGAGDWRATDKYGEVWVPTALPATWTPYRDGHWRWLAPWGWSWVDDQPWGFATSHYGRWLYGDGHWSWVPGKLTAHPVWAPAVVAFLGTPGVGLSYADGSGPAIAWFPLAPGEIYWPSYTRDLDYIRAINRGDAADLDAIRIDANGEPPAEITNAHFANRAFASVVPRTVFTAGQPIAAALLTIPDQRLRNAPAIMGSPRIGAPPPVRVAATPPSGGHQPGSRVAVARSAKLAAWDAAVRIALIRSRNFQANARLRFVRLRVFTSAEGSHLRHTIVLRVARSDHAAAASAAHRRVVRR